MDKLLSIIIPSYNMEKYLPKCIGSLIVGDSQLLQKLDIIVVNDGSKDRTSEIAHEFEVKYPGVIQVIDKGNGHYGSCVNAALPVAKGKYVRILDADDHMDSSAFMSYLLWLDDASKKWDPDCVVSDFCYVDDADNVTSVTHYGFPTNNVFTLDESLAYSKVNIGVHAVAHKTVLIRESGFRQTEGMPYTDTEWSFFPMFRVRTVAYFPKAVKRYLEGREGQTMSPVQLRANATKYIQVAVRIFEEYGTARENLTRDNERYCHHVVVDLVWWILSIYLLNEYAGSIPIDVAKRFDEALRLSAPDIFAESDEFVASRIRFHFVREWRRGNYNDDGFLFKAYRIYRKIVMWMKR